MYVGIHSDPVASKPAPVASAMPTLTETFSHLSTTKRDAATMTHNSAAGTYVRRIHILNSE